MHWRADSLIAVITTLGIFAGATLDAFAHPPTTIQAKRRSSRVTSIEVEKADVPENERVIAKVKVIDADTKEILPHRVHIEDSEGNYYSPEGHLPGRLQLWQANDNSDELDTINEDKVWAMIRDGEFVVHLRDNTKYKVQVEHGLEYERPTIEFELTGKAGQTIAHAIPLKQSIDMQARGWMSADTHVHDLTPLGAIREMPIEDIDYVNLMFIGPSHPLLQKGFITGQPNEVSTPERIVYVSQEVRDANQGHMTLMGMREPIQPIRTYTGVEQSKAMKPLPNEPLNWEVWDRMHAQDGLAFHAHYLYWPGHGSAVGAALKMLDGLEWLQTDIVERGSKTRQDIEVPAFGLRGAGPMWYDMLNCGAQLPIVGGTDKMGSARTLGCSSRTYAKVDEWSHEGFMNALRAGATFLTNGPLLHFTANGEPIGSHLKFQGDGPFTVTVETGCFTHRPISYFEIIQNGKVVHRQPVKEDQQQVELSKDLTFDRSGWLAVRCGHTKPDIDNWHHVVSAAHSSPIYVTVNDEPPYDLDSAKYMVARVGVTIEWSGKDAMWSSEEYQERALKSFRAAQDYYKEVLARAEKNAAP